MPALLRKTEKGAWGKGSKNEGSKTIAILILCKSTDEVAYHRGTKISKVD